MGFMNDMRPLSEVPPMVAKMPDNSRYLGVAGIRQWGPALLVIAGAAPVNFALVIPRPILKFMDAELGGAASGGLLLTLIIAIIGLSVVVGAPLAGVLIRKFGLRVVMAASFALFATAGTLPYFMNNLGHIVLSRALLGLGVAGIQVSAISLAGDLYAEEKRAQILGFMMAGASFAALVLGPLSGLIGDFGWRAPFLLYLTGIPFILLSLAVLPKLATAPVVTAQGRPDTLSGFRFPYLLITLGFVAGLIMTLPPVYLAFRLAETGVVSPSKIGASFIAISIPELICASFYGSLRGRLSAHFMCALGFAFAAVGLAAISISPSYAGVLIGMALLGPAIAFIYASVMERAVLYGEHRSRVAGMVVSAIFLSLITGAFGLEPVFHAFGSAGVMMLLAAIGAVTALALLRAAIAERAAGNTMTSEKTERSVR